MGVRWEECRRSTSTVITTLQLPGRFAQIHPPPCFHLLWPLTMFIIPTSQLPGGIAQGDRRDPGAAPGGGGLRTGQDV